MQIFFVGIAKKINSIFLVNSNKISIDPYLNENFCWVNQIFVVSTKHFSGCDENSDFILTYVLIIIPLPGKNETFFRKYTVEGRV